MSIADVETARGTSPDGGIRFERVTGTIGAIVHGECLCSIGGLPVRARAGDLLAIAPQTVHTGALTPAGGDPHVSVVMFYVAPAWFAARRLAPPPGSGFLHRPALAAAAEGMASADAVEAWIVGALPTFAAGLTPPARDRAPSPAARAILNAVRDGLTGGLLVFSAISDGTQS